MTALAVLRGALRLLSKPRGWLQGPYARNRHGHSVQLFSKSACRFCFDGALLSASGSESLGGNADYRRAKKYVEQVLPDSHPGPISFNEADATRKSDVLSVLRKAIRKAESNE